MLGEPKLVAVSMFCVAASLGPLPFATGWSQILPLLALLSMGSSMTRPPVFGMISNLTSADEQGVTLGVAQSAGSLARIVGPMFALPLFAWKPSVPYVICAAVALFTGLLAMARLSKGYTPPSALPKA
jgi:sugar phosphate permease